MEVLIENQQEKINVTVDMEKLIKLVAEACIESEGFNTQCEIDISLVDNERIREINREHRKLDKPTDVLSFPMLEFIDGKIIDSSGDFDLDSNLLLLGDIVLSLEMAQLQSEEYGHSLIREVAFLISHGVYHLLGYDHMESQEEEIMLSKQEAVLQKLGITR